MSSDQLGKAILYVIAFVLCTSVHEFGHAWMANRLGDPTPKAQGRLTLSPLRHIDPVGTLIMPLVMFLYGAGGGRAPLLAWGRPVETNPMNYTRRLSMSTGRMLVAVAGPLMNLAMALVVSLVIVVGGVTGLMPAGVAEALTGYLVVLNLYLMFFNLLPIPPLDGGAVLAWFLPRSMQSLVDFLNRWGFLILIGLLFVPALLRVLMLPATVTVNLWVATLWSVMGL